MLKHCVLALILAGLVCSGALSLRAQDSNSQANDQQSASANGLGHGRRHFDPAKRTETLTKQLKLTSDQQPKVLDILKTEQTQMEGLRSDSSASQEDRHSKMMDIHKTSNEQIRVLLTADQQKKWDAIQSRHAEWGHHHDGQGSGGDSDQK